MQCVKQQHLIQGQEDPASSSVGEAGGGVWWVFLGICTL